MLKGKVGSQEKRPDLVTRNHERDAGAMLVKKKKSFDFNLSRYLRKQWSDVTEDTPRMP